MANYFLLDLDTTAPRLTINAPFYSVPSNTIEITIKSNEVLGEYQDIYIIDSLNTRHDLTFLRFDDYTYLGYVPLDSFPLGISNLYVRMMDVVDNVSDIFTASIFIGTFKDKINAYVKSKQRDIDISLNYMNKEINLMETTRDISYLEFIKDIKYKEANKNITITETSKKITHKKLDTKISNIEFDTEITNTELNANISYEERLNNTLIINRDKDMGVE